MKFLQRATSSNKKHGKRFQHIAFMWQWLWHILFEKEIFWCSVIRAGVGLWREECSWLVCNVKLRQVTGGMTVALGRATAKTWAPDIFGIGIYLASEYNWHQNISEYTYFKKHSWDLLSKQLMALCDCTSYVWLILIWFSNVRCSFNGVKTNSLILEPLSRPTIISLVEFVDACLPPPGCSILSWISRESLFSTGCSKRTSFPARYPLIPCWCWF